MQKLPLMNGIINYAEQNNILFCMPGHKGGRGFIRIPEGKEYFKNIFKCDVTEVEGTDNLHDAEGIIKESGILLSRYYGSAKSYFLVNGSTSGNFIMIFSAFNEGDKVIVERNCHRSVMNAIIMRKLRPVYIKDIVSKKYNAPLSLNEEHFYKVIEENKDAKGIVITYPNYYGVCCNLEKITAFAKKFKMKVLVDSAHGAHFGANSNLPRSAVKLGADMAVMSAHKTLPSLTQTAYLHVGKNCSIDIDKIDFYFSAFSTTSPSYIFLSSMDYARYYLEKYGNEDYSILLDMIEEYRQKIDAIDKMHIIEKKDFDAGCYVYDMDKTKLVINLDKGYSGNKLSKYLKKCGIQVEMSDISNILLIITPFNERNDMEALYNALKNCDFNDIKNDYDFEMQDFDIPLSVLYPWEAQEREKIKIDIEEAQGRICAENIIPYPPGVPVIVMGEKIDDEIISLIKYFIKNNIQILGVKDGKISVIK